MKHLQWTKEKPNKEGVFIMGQQLNIGDGRKDDYEMGRIEKIISGNPDDGEGLCYYLGWCDMDGNETECMDELPDIWYLMLPSLPDSEKEKEEK